MRRIGCHAVSYVMVMNGTRYATDATNAQIAVTPSCSVTCLTSACAAPVHDVPVLRGADHENTKATTPMADNRRADHRRRAGVDRTRNGYRELTHFEWVGLLEA